MKLLWWLVVLVAALSQQLHAHLLASARSWTPVWLPTCCRPMREVADLLSLRRMLLAVLAVLLLPTWWLLRAHPRHAAAASGCGK